MPRSSSGLTLSVLAPCGRQPNATLHAPALSASGVERLAPQVDPPEQRRVQLGDGRRPSCRDVTASISAPGCRSRILMSSTAVYPDPPRMATLVMFIVRGPVVHNVSLLSVASWSNGPPRYQLWPSMNTIASAAAAIRRGRTHPVELLDQCLGRIDRLRGPGPGLGASSTATGPGPTRFA